MEWEEIERALLVVAHPDDIEFGSAGTAARLTQDGKQVAYVIVTDGSKGSSDPDMTPERLTAVRKEEQRNAARVAGVKDVSFLDFSDGMLEPTLEVRKSIAGCIRHYKPDVVICQNPNRELAGNMFAQHPDHLATAEATLAAVYPTARDRMAFPELLEQGLEPHAVREVWVQGTSAPDYFVDISATLQTKIEALLEHKSQVQPERITAMVPERARQVGQLGDMEFAEGYRRIRLG